MTPFKVIDVYLRDKRRKTEKDHVYSCKNAWLPDRHFNPALSKVLLQILTTAPPHSVLDFGKSSHSHVAYFSTVLLRAENGISIKSYV